MSTQPSIVIPPAASPDYPPPAVNAQTPTVPDAGVFTADEIQFLESVLLYWETTSPLARPFENTDPVKDGYDPMLQALTAIRAKLAALRPTVT